MNATLRSRTQALMAASALTLASLAALTAATPARATAGVATAVPAVAQPNGEAVANLWEWNWRSIASECKDRLGPAGFGGVQVAPPAESVSLPANGHPWWEVYQPVSYKLESRLGTRSEFAAMVTSCHDAGVKVIADTVVNHMAGSNNTATTGYAGSTFNPSGYEYPAVPYAHSDFHHPGDGCPTTGGINNWNDPAQVQSCELVSLSDLYTQKNQVREKLAAYLNDLISLGVDGFRVDAAKHVPQADFAAILAKVNNTTWQHTRPYVAQEVMPGGTGMLAPSAFKQNGSLLDFVYAQKMKDQFNGDIANLKTFGTSWGIEPSDKSYAMITNHDLERNGSTLSYKDGASYKLANYFMLAWPHGVPQVYDGFTFSDNDASPPADSTGRVSGTDCAGAWQCVHRDQGVVGLVGWRNTVGTAPVTNWASPSANVIAFSRGTKGWLAINNSTTASTTTYTTSLPDGAYCDVISGAACSGTKVTVSGGSATVTVPAKSAVALHVNARSGDPIPAATTVYVHKDVGWGNRITIRGSVGPLSWSKGQDCVNQAAALWKCSISGIASGSSFEYKALINDRTWSIGANYTAVAGRTYDIYPTF